MEKEKCLFCDYAHETKTCPMYVDEELEKDNSSLAIAKLIDHHKQLSELKGFNSAIDKAIIELDRISAEYHSSTLMRDRDIRAGVITLRAALKPALSMLKKEAKS